MIAVPGPSGASPLVAMREAGLARGGRWLVRGVNLSLRRGEIVTLIGPNGSGKSTTAKLVLGVHRPSEGEVTRDAALRVGYVPQKFAIDWTLPLTVARLMTLTAPASPAMVQAALERVGIAHLSKARAADLSGGEFQRALLARAILRRPDLLVLDEPVQGVDFSGQIALYDLIADIRDREGCAILLISHDLHVVMAKTDTVLCLNGHVCCAGTPQSVAASPAYRTLFGPRAAETLAIYAHDHDHTHLPDGRVRLADGTLADRCTPAAAPDGQGHGWHGASHHHHDRHEHHAGHAHPADAAGAPSRPAEKETLGA
ncbi:metal ABC transporter ATP-binding protein [Aurantimonas sp. Leaf443]|uniref:ATP-binding cassette domain-containing protein n=1 Tax=Aurantimonas sp. Leaf443 TaxID=1736378 RepID=UPI0006F6BA7B|nr:metal ABC transporter ATP-binding protein [Aurantimonas sp. Leaf443]KQT85142.1 zinc ABC transporter ATP-binding protein [Aurantimonas sp. Leaf443]